MDSKGGGDDLRDGKPNSRHPARKALRMKQSKPERLARWKPRLNGWGRSARIRRNACAFPDGKGDLLIEANGEGAGEH